MDGTKRLIKYSNVDLRQAEVVVLRNVDLEVHEGEFIYLIGRVGSGKSTLLKSFYAEVPIASADQAQVFEFDLTKIKRRKVPYLRRQLGIVYQDLQLLTDRTVFDNLAFVLKATGWRKEEREKRIREVLLQVGMENKGYKMPHQLSGGEQQRIVIARALLNNPQIILADEPTGHLDPETGREIVQLLHRISENGTTVIMSTHNLSWLELFPGRVLRFDDERMQEVFASENEDDWAEDELSQIITDVQKEEEENEPAQTSSVAVAAVAMDATVDDSETGTWKVEETEPEEEKENLQQFESSYETTSSENPSETTPLVTEPLTEETTATSGNEERKENEDEKQDERINEQTTVSEEEEEAVIAYDKEEEETPVTDETIEVYPQESVEPETEPAILTESAPTETAETTAPAEKKTEEQPVARVNNDRWSLRDEQMRRIREAHEKMAREARAHDEREMEDRRKANEMMRKAEEEHERLIREEQIRNRAEQEREERNKKEREHRMAEEHDRIVKETNERMEREERENIEANEQLKAKTNSIADESLRWTNDDSSSYTEIQSTKSEEERQREAARRQAEANAREEARQKALEEAKDEVMRELERQIAEAHKNKKRIEIPKRDVE
ncbi:MAG: ATP-binding cassette domain-containing protein [Paludibacteraceae bacterium]|nr:ATP-binding cassette domain-containing protein [Paludibacteraceae bacterium]